MRNVRVLIADDYAAVRTALAKALCCEPGIEVVGEASDGYSAVVLAEKLKPDVVLMDVNMPRLDGVEATRCIVQRDPRIKVIGLSVHCFDFLAQRMLDAGANAYVLKDGDVGELLEVIEGVCLGRTYVSSAVLGLDRPSARLRMPRRLSHAG
jgi:DNA-binding NarL/FixJ family response regulator